MNINHPILKLYNEIFFADPDFKGTVDDLPMSLQEMITDWEHGYKTLGGNLNMCSRQIASLLFVVWEATQAGSL